MALQRSWIGEVASTLLDSQYCDTGFNFIYQRCVDEELTSTDLGLLVRDDGSCNEPLCNQLLADSPPLVPGNSLMV